MNSAASLEHFVQHLRTQVRGSAPVARVGSVVQVTGLVIESEGPNVSLGDVCEIRSSRSSLSLSAEVVGFRDHRVLLMPLGEMDQIHAGCEVIATDIASSVPVGPGLIGRVLDGLGQPIDGRGPLVAESYRPLRAAPPNPLQRQRITTPFETGVRAIDTFTPVGQGQRLGIFAGSGVDESSTGPNSSGPATLSIC